ncbi:hypothetical protein [Endozoicomonas atrinae]|uniref:hypothetical protein n=1 Tax=Endozoicomonas atrinae TaxID=1333660 RepID=UPI003AFFB137
MYIGPDGRVYQNKFDSIGHSTKMPGYAEEQRQINDRLHELRQRQRDAIDQRQMQELRQQQIDAGNTQNFHDRYRQHDVLVNRQYGMGLPGRQASTQSVPQPIPQQGGQGGYGMPMERKETVTDPLVQDAGRLHDMLNKEYRRQRGMAEPSAVDPNDLYNAKAARGDDGFEGLTQFINQHPGIKANNVSGVRFNDSDRNNDPLVSLIGDDGNPVKQFYLSSLSNLNNFASQKKQTFDPGNKVNDPGKLMEQLQEVATAQAQADVAGLKPKDQKAQLLEAIKDHYGQLMKQFGPRNPGYVTTGEATPNRTPGFDLFAQPQRQQQDPLAALKQALGGGDALTPAPPPPVTPNTAVPKQGQGYGYPSYNPMNRAPSTFQHFHPSYGR